MVIRAVDRCGARKTLAALLLPLGAAAFDPAMAQSQKASELTPSPPGASVYFVELKDGAKVSEEELVAHCRARMAGFKIPRSFVFGPLPKTSTGKIQKFVLRDRAKSASAIE